MTLHHRVLPLLCLSYTLLYATSFTTAPLKTAALSTMSGYLTLESTTVLYAKKKARASSNKGFGAAPMTVDEYAASLSNRIPTSPEALQTSACPCGSGSLYADCCRPYHQGSQFPQEPLRVLQSRYSAFYYRIPMYILQTSHPECNDYSEDRMAWLKDLNKAGMFDGYNFVALEPGETVMSADKDDEAFIEFRVRLKDKNPLNRKSTDDEIVIRERSRFLRDEQGWKYAGGDVSRDDA
jgi:SEC-C motif domain protein